MGRIVAATGVPHTPAFPAHVARAGADCEEARLYAKVYDVLERLNPDVIVMFSNDHFNTFFFDNFPLFAIGVAPATSGPNDQTPMPAYDVPVDEALAEHFRRAAITHDFDMAVTQEFALDHAFMVPWHFLNATRRTPLVPVFIHGFSDPLPNAMRAWELGQMLGRAVQDFPQDRRVAVIGSGSFSLEIGGPLVPQGERSGTPDKVWAGHVENRLRKGEIAQLISEATCERMQRAGNAAGELLNWLAMLGMLSAQGPLPKPLFLDPQVSHGHAFGVWLASGAEG